MPLALPRAPLLECPLHLPPAWSPAPLTLLLRRFIQGHSAGCGAVFCLHVTGCILAKSQPGTGRPLAGWEQVSGSRNAGAFAPLARPRPQTPGRQESTVITGQADLGRALAGPRQRAICIRDSYLPGWWGGLGEAPACEALSTGLGCACDFDI